MSDIAVDVQNVSMKFDLEKEKTDNFKEFVLKKLRGKIKYEEFYALQDISLTIRKGESWGILGKNGSGKSTLLKTISGIYKPTFGNIIIQGNVAPLIELGAGFDMNLTAAENIYLNGAVLGYAKSFITQKYDEILTFAELKEFENVPLKNYSSGMVARLGFSIATLVKPDILIVDEVLAVGDMAFQMKCEKKINSLLSGGTTLIFVSHSIEQVKRLCEHAVWVDFGRIRKMGDISEVGMAYEQYMLNCYEGSKS